MKYLDENGLSKVFTLIKAQYAAKSDVPTNLNQLTNGPGYITGVSWDDIANKPETFAVATHTHTTADVTALTGYTVASTVGAIATSDSLNTALGKLQKSINTVTSDYAPLNAPAFTGNPTVAGTLAANDNSTKVATTAFVQSAVANLVNSAPTTLDTLAELAAALGDDPNFATTMATALGGKAPLNHEHASSHVTLMTGYAKASSASAITTTDTLNQAIGKLEKALDGKQASGSYAAASHTHVGTEVTLTGYTKASAAAAVAATDNVNQAIGKLEYKIDVITELSNQDIQDIWDEVLNPT